MRIGYALDVHATRSSAGEVAWPNLLEQVRLAEQVGFDLVVLPDHLHYRAGGEGDYAREDEAVGARESTTLAGALAAATDVIGIGHSVMNAPYRPPALMAHVARTLDDVSGGRYSLTVGAGNSFDYDAIGVEADHRHARFAESLAILHGLLAGEVVDFDGEHVRSRDAELVLPGHDGSNGPPLIVAAAGPRSRRLAVRYGDGWNGFAATDPEHTDLRRALADLDRACEEAGRDPASLSRCLDLGVDPLDLHGAKELGEAAVLALPELGMSEVRCYLESRGTHASRMAAIEAMADLVAACHG